MTFAHPHLLWLLVVPVALLVESFRRRVRAAENPHHKIPRATFSSSGLKPRSSALRRRPVAACLALALLVVGLARPQGATLSTPSFTQARDVLVAVDVSRSMLADDVAPSRLARAQLLVRDLADELKGERLGLLPFAGTAFLQSPLSADYEIFRTFLDELGPDMIPAGGSDFAALLRAADEAFGLDENAPPDTPSPDRFLIVLSDGEAESDDWRPLAQKLADRGVRILALGLGTPAGAMIPDGQGGLVKDERGAVVLTRLDPATLRELARLSDGAYRDASSWVDLPALLRDTIARGRATRVATDESPRRRELFAWFLAPALALLLLSLAREFPAVPRPARVSARSLRPLPPPLPRVVARALPVALALHCALAFAPRAFAQTAPETAPPPDPLVELVDKLASAPTPSAPDLARLAALTADRAEASRAAPAQAPAPFPEGAIRDALAAVSAGQAADPRAADWPALRKRLEALLTPPPSQSSPSPPSQAQDQDPQKPDQKKPPEQQDPSDQSSSPDSPPSSDQQQQQSDSGPGSSSSKENPDASSDATSRPDSSASPQDSASASKPKPDDASKPLGDLGAKEPEEKPKESPAPKDGPSSGDRSDQPPPDEPTQQAGGISTSGRPTDGDAAGSLEAIDPALVVPQQRLERVRESDAPARLFQLLQESETPPEARERPAPGAKQTW